MTVLGRRILSVELRKTDFIDDPSLVERHLPGRRIEAVERYGKFMLLRLSAAPGAETPAQGDNAPAVVYMVSPTKLYILLPQPDARVLLFTH